MLVGMTLMFDSEDTDIFYESQLFDFTEPYEYNPKHADIFKGGTGIDIEKKAPQGDRRHRRSWTTHSIHNTTIQCSFSLVVASVIAHSA